MRSGNAPARQGRVHGFFETLREACPLVDEANEITRTMIAHQNLKFEARAAARAAV